MNRLLMGSQRLLFPFVLLLLCSCVQLSKPSSPQWSLSAPPKFVVVAKGTYVWGSPKSEEGHQPAEAQQSVEITKGFEVSTTEVTQLQWFEVMGNNPSKFSTNAVCPRTYQEIDGVGVCGDFPVEQVSWVDIQEFLSRLNHLIRDGYHYRLPTEAEWEYFARANTTTAYSFGDSPEPGMDYGWFKENSPQRTSPVALKRPNPWGLYDVHGNNWEWTQDLWKRNRSAPHLIDPKGGKTGEFRVVRGGGWFFSIADARSARRAPWHQLRRIDDVGFRLVRVKVAQLQQP